jgi:hypothetical protein
MSIGKKRQAQKAIVDRGWFVLNYVLLKDRRLQKITDNHSNLSVSATSESTGNNASDVSINRSGPFFQSCLTKIINEEAKACGRKRKWEEEQKHTATMKCKFDRLRDVGNIRSGNLASMNCYVLDETVLDVLKEQEDKSRAEKENKEMRRVTLIEKEQKKFKDAAVKFKTNQKLLVGDMRSLLKKIQSDGDLPVISKQDDLTSQLQRRMPRLRLFLDPLYEDFSEMSNEANVNDFNLRLHTNSIDGENVVHRIDFCESAKKNNNKDSNEEVVVEI